LQNSDETIIYDSPDGMRFEVDVNSSMLVASSGMGYSLLSLIDKVSDGLQQLTSKAAPLLPDKED
jgi:hypothetical protein